MTNDTQDVKEPEQLGLEGIEADSKSDNGAPAFAGAAVCALVGWVAGTAYGGYRQDGIGMAILAGVFAVVWLLIVGTMYGGRLLPVAPFLGSAVWAWQLSKLAAVYSLLGVLLGAIAGGAIGGLVALGRRGGQRASE